MGKRGLSSLFSLPPLPPPQMARCILKEEMMSLGPEGKQDKGRYLPGFPAGRLVGPGERLEGWGCLVCEERVGWVR